MELISRFRTIRKIYVRTFVRQIRILIVVVTKMEIGWNPETIETSDYQSRQLKTDTRRQEEGTELIVIIEYLIKPNRRSRIIKREKSHSLKLHFVLKNRKMNKAELWPLNIVVRHSDIVFQETNHRERR